MITRSKEKKLLNSSRICSNGENEETGRARNSQQQRGKETSIPVAIQLKQPSKKDS